jgi:hypothetical protein
MQWILPLNVIIIRRHDNLFPFSVAGDQDKLTKLALENKNKTGSKSQSSKYINIAKEKK